MLMLPCTAMNRTKVLVTEISLFLMLPDDLLLNCLARVSRLYYPTLALVSKKFRSLLASVERYQTRTLLGCTETCVYVCLRYPCYSNPIRWFTLCQRPIQITDPNSNLKPRYYTPRFAPYRCIKNCTRKNNEKLSENFLVSIPTPSSPSVGSVGIVAIGYNIYKIGGLINGVPSSRVFFMDCRSHTWHEAPSMQIARKLPSVSVLDGKIYVVEGCENLDLSNKVECFDPKTQLWENKLSPDAELYGRLEEKHFNWHRSRCCVIDNVLYCYYTWLKRFEWYDSEAGIWRDLKGLEKLPKLPKPYGNSDYFTMATYGGKIVILWEKDEFMGKKIWCTEISLERHNRQEMHGKIEWCGVVLTVPRLCYILHSLAVTV